MGTKNDPYEIEQNRALFGTAVNKLAYLMYIIIQHKNNKKTI